MPAILGMRGTGDFTTDFRPTNYRELFTFLEPNGDAPLNAVLAMLDSEGTDDPKFNNFRDELPTRAFKAAAAYASGVTAIATATAADAAWVVKGDLIVNANTGELMRATVDGNGTTGAITVTRNIGGTALAIALNDDLFVAGHAANEGDVTGTGVTFDPTVDFNYTQIFKKPFSITNTQANTYLRTGNKEDEYTTKALKLHMSDIERSMLWSKRSESTGSNGQKLRTTGGLFSVISTVEDANTYSTPGKIDEDTFDRLLIEKIFAYGSKTKIAFGGAKVAGHLLAFGKARWTPQSVDNSYGIKFTRYTTPAGDLLFYLHPQFRHVPKQDSTMLILDTASIKYRYMNGRDTDLIPNRQGNDADARTHEYLTECGLELLMDRVNVVIKNWTKIA
jgi:hypothetical protein